MALVNLTQAAKLAGISRTTLYNTYINPGVINLSKNKQGNKQIDTAELLRVFGELQAEQLDNTDERSPELCLTPESAESGHPEHIEQRVRLAELETENRMLKDQVSELKEQRHLDREQIKDLNTKLLEHHRPDRLWWQFWR